MKVKKRNGRLEDFNVDKINKCAERACKNLENVSASEVLIDAKIKLYDKVTTIEIDKSLIMSARSKIEFANCDGSCLERTSRGTTRICVEVL